MTTMIWPLALTVSVALSLPLIFPHLLLLNLSDEDRQITVLSMCQRATGDNPTETQRHRERERECRNHVNTKLLSVNSI